MCCAALHLFHVCRCEMMQLALHQDVNMSERVFFLCEYFVSINNEVFHTVKAVTDKLKLAHTFFIAAPCIL